MGRLRCDDACGVTHFTSCPLGSYGAKDCWQKAAMAPTPGLAKDKKKKEEKKKSLEKLIARVD